MPGLEGRLPPARGTGWGAPLASPAEGEGVARSSWPGRTFLGQGALGGPGLGPLPPPPWAHGMGLGGWHGKGTLHLFPDHAMRLQGVPGPAGWRGCFGRHLWGGGAGPCPWWDAVGSLSWLWFPLPLWPQLTLLGSWMKCWPFLPPPPHTRLHGHPVSQVGGRGKQRASSTSSCS